MTVSKEILEKVRHVYRQKHVKVNSNGKRSVYYYWVGYWRENGKSCTVHLGKELPGEVKSLIKGRMRSIHGNALLCLKSPAKEAQKGSYVF